jgi:hypothetical protein
MPPLAFTSFLAAFLALQEAPQPSFENLLSRVAEEAEVLQQNAPKALTQETLEQRTMMPPSRFRPRMGKAALEPLKLRLQVREIVSEYSVGVLKEAQSRDLIEFRQVVSVDGKKVQSPEAARHALSLGVHSADDRARKRMLEDFARHGLVDVATDYGLILLAFTKRGMQGMQIQPMGESQMGADIATIFVWKQTTNAEGALVFAGRQALRQALQGTLWVRKSDGLPLRVQAVAERLEQNHRIRDEATVDYMMSNHGFLTPASVVHRHVIDGSLLTENLYRYDPFKLFTADTEIKFTDLPDPPPAAAPIKK